MKSLFRLSRHEVGPWLLWIINRQRQVADRSVSVPMTLSDLERRHARGHVSQRIFVRTLVPFHLELLNLAR